MDRDEIAIGQSASRDAGLETQAGFRRAVSETDPCAGHARILDMYELRSTSTRGVDAAMTLVKMPALLAQVAWVVMRTPSLPEASGPRSGVAGQGRPLRLLVVGDSSAAGVGVDTQDEALAGQLVRRLAPRYEVSWHVHARSGATTADTLETLAAARPGPVDVVVTALGVNDVKNGVALEDWLDATQTLHGHLKTHLKAKHIVVSGMPPLDRFPAFPRLLGQTLSDRAARFEAALVAELHRCGSDVLHLPFDYDLRETDMARDGFHPGAPLYGIWADQVMARLAPVLGQARMS